VWQHLSSTGAPPRCHRVVPLSIPPFRWARPLAVLDSISLSRWFPKSFLIVQVRSKHLLTTSCHHHVTSSPLVSRLPLCLVQASAPNHVGRSRHGLSVHAKLWTLSRKVNPNAFLDKATKTTRITKEINRNKIMWERSIVLIGLLPLAHTHWPYLYNSTLISLQLFKPTHISLQLDLWLTWTLPHDLYLFWTPNLILLGL
jgi:hypothetical protein